MLAGHGLAPVVRKGQPVGVAVRSRPDQGLAAMQISPRIIRASRSALSFVVLESGARFRSR